MVSLLIGQRLSNSCLRSLILFELYPNSTINLKLIFLSGNKHETMIFHKTEFTLIWVKLLIQGIRYQFAKLPTFITLSLESPSKHRKAGAVLWIHVCPYLTPNWWVGIHHQFPARRNFHYKIQNNERSRRFQTDSKRVCNYISSHLSVVKINQYHIQMYILMSKCFWTLRNEDIYQQWTERVLKF